jgi:hypothetical protein
VQVQQHTVGGKQPEPGAGCLRDDQAVDRIVPDQLGEFADRLGVLGGDAEQFDALPIRPSAAHPDHEPDFSPIRTINTAANGTTNM